MSRGNRTRSASVGPATRHQVITADVEDSDPSPKTVYKPGQQIGDPLPALQLKAVNDLVIDAANSRRAASAPVMASPELNDEADALVNDFASFSGVEIVTPRGSAVVHPTASPRVHPTSSPPVHPLSYAEIQAKVQIMLERGIDKSLIARYVKQQKALLQEAALSSQPSPISLVMSTGSSASLDATSPRLAPVSPFRPLASPVMAPAVPPFAIPSKTPGTPRTNGMPTTPTSRDSPRAPMTNEQIQEKAKDMLAYGSDKAQVAAFIKFQRENQARAQQQMEAQMEQQRQQELFLQQRQQYLQQQAEMLKQQMMQPLFRYQSQGEHYEGRSPSGLPICYECRYEMLPQENPLCVTSRFAYSCSCYHQIFMFLLFSV